MEERREQFQCSYCGQKFNFRKDAETHEQNCPKNRDFANMGLLTATGLKQSPSLPQFTG
jgi:hypothetical protein